MGIGKKWNCIQWFYLHLIGLNGNLFLDVYLYLPPSPLLDRGGVRRLNIESYPELRIELLPLMPRSGGGIGIGSRRPIGTKSRPELRIPLLPMLEYLRSNISRLSSYRS